MSVAVHVHLAEVLDHRRVAPEHYVLSLDAPEIARDALPGQFVMVRRPEGYDPLLPRAFSVYHAEEEAGYIELLYREVGRGTGALRRVDAGNYLHVWGPLGNAFRLPAGDRVVLVAGGVGVPPLVFWSARLAALQAPVEQVALVGASTGAFLVGVEHLRHSGAEVHVSTDDGSMGHHGRVTDLLPRHLEERRVNLYACGPMPMLAAVARICEARGVHAELALEAPMACGVGACLGCTVPLVGGGFARVCTEGAVFVSGRVAWEQL